jgi:hypothetical protein
LALGCIRPGGCSVVLEPDDQRSDTFCIEHLDRLWRVNQRNLLLRCRRRFNDMLKTQRDLENSSSRKATDPIWSPGLLLKVCLLHHSIHLRSRLEQPLSLPIRIGCLLFVLWGCESGMAFSHFFCMKWFLFWFGPWARSSS